MIYLDYLTLFVEVLILIGVVVLLFRTKGKSVSVPKDLSVDGNLGAIDKHTTLFGKMMESYLQKDPYINGEVTFTNFSMDIDTRVLTVNYSVAKTDGTTDTTSIQIHASTMVTEERFIDETSKHMCRYNRKLEDQIKDIKQK